jgi:hypothetical protein
VWSVWDMTYFVRVDVITDCFDSSAYESDYATCSQCRMVEWARIKIRAGTRRRKKIMNDTCGLDTLYVNQQSFFDCQTNQQFEPFVPLGETAK